MTRGAELAYEALAAGLLLSRNGERIHIESPLGRPLPGDLHRRLLTDKQEVLAWLDFCAAADRLLLGTLARLGRARSGRTATAEQREQAEAALQEAHRSGEISLFTAALDHYERTVRGPHQLREPRESEER